MTDRIHEIRTRFEVLKRDRIIAYQKQLLGDAEDNEVLKHALEKDLAQLDDDFAFIAECNLGGEFMEQERLDRLKQISGYEWSRTLDDRIGISFDEAKRKNRTEAPELPVTERLLSDRPDHIVEHDVVVHSADPNNPYGFKVDVPEHKYNLGEVYNLSVARGTLTNEERFKITITLCKPL